MHITDPDIRDRARRMRHQPTRSEARVWRWLRARRFAAYKFRRQYPIGPYILDFYCRELKLAIELDGSQHASFPVADLDDTRTAMLRGYGIEVLRLPNKLIATDTLTSGGVHSMGD